MVEVWVCKTASNAAHLLVSRIWADLLQAASLFVQPELQRNESQKCRCINVIFLIRQEQWNSTLY